MKNAREGKLERPSRKLSEVITLITLSLSDPEQLAVLLELEMKDLRNGNSAFSDFWNFIETEDDTLSRVTVLSVAHAITVLLAQEENPKNPDKICIFLMDFLLNSKDSRKIYLFASGICKLVLQFTVEDSQNFKDALKNCNAELLRRSVVCLNNLLSSHFENFDDRDINSCSVSSVAHTLKYLYEANEQLGIVEKKAFVNENINEHALRHDTETYIQNEVVSRNAGVQFTFFDFPFLLDSHAKSQMLLAEIEFRQKMDHINEMMMYRDRFELLLSVRRNSILLDAMGQISTIRSIDKKRLRRPLKVEFSGEDAVDDGGVRKEFFHLVMKELFDLNYGLFITLEETHEFWIRAHNTLTHALEDYQLVGNLFGLAVCNGVHLEVPFSKIIYKKLLGRPLVFKDLELLMPV
jgi:hypothetical protein